MQYYYAVKARDGSLNRSDYSNRAMATASGGHTLLCHLAFDADTRDSTPNLNHAAPLRTASFAPGRVGSGALRLNGTQDFVQLPATLPHRREISVSAWVYWNGGAAWQRIFDFGNDTSQNMFLTPSSGARTLRFAIKNGGAEQQLDAPEIAKGSWTHVAVTLGATEARLYVNGRKLAESTTLTLRPGDFRPVLNYIGQSQYAADPLLSGAIDDFRIYNYALTESEVATLAAPP